MAWSKPFDEVEITYVEANYPAMTCARIATKLGRSERGVQNLVARLGLRGKGASCACAMDGPSAGAPDAGTPEVDGGPQDELEELREIKQVLKHALRHDADPRDIPKLSAELREVIKRISDLEGGEDGPGGAMAGGAGNIVVSVPLRPA